MIKNLYGNGSWVNVQPSSTTMPYVNTSQPLAGMLRMNAGMNRIEVYDGSNWQSFGSDAHVDLSENAKEVLRWAQDKMREEAELKKLMEKHPGLKDLQEKFEMMKILCKEEEKIK